MKARVEPSVQALPIAHIIERHAEEAAFLWTQRRAALRQPHYDLPSLAELEERLAANLDGLLVAGDSGWVAVEGLLELAGPGEIFVGAWLAGQADDGKKLDRVMQAVADNSSLGGALTSALAWQPLGACRPLIEALLEANSAQYYWLGINLCALYRYDPQELLLKQFQLGNAAPEKRARALRACGELGRRDLLPELRKVYWDADPKCAFWALWSGALLGDESAVMPLRAFVLTPSEFSEAGLALLMRLLSREAQSELLRYLAANSKTERLALQGAGWSGNIGWIPGLLARMDNDATARVSGEAFAMLTGADLKYLDLDRDRPANFQSGPSDDPQDEDVSLDPDEDLPWPDRALVTAWWQQQSKMYEPSQRYLCGQIISRESCYEVLRKGYQRQRHSAALELCLLGEGLFPTSAPAKMQKALLASKTSC